MLLLSVLVQEIYGQWNAVVLKSTELEAQGVEGYFKNQLAVGGNLKLLNKNPGGELYQYFYKGFKVPGFQVALQTIGDKLLISWYLEKNAVFEEIPLSITGDFEWLKRDYETVYRLYGYSDSVGVRKYIHFSGNDILTMDYRRRTGKDSTTKARVFLPDPLSPYNTIYGGKYSDFSDSTNAELLSRHSWVDLKCRFSNDSFRLENQYLSFAEVSPPLKKHAVHKTEFSFVRSDEQFEEVQVFYHLTNLMNWWDSLGFPYYKDTVSIDVHALYGIDESLFDPLSDPPTLEFGDGGVDDAEDADAVVHEYTHAAIYNVIPNAYFGTQRQAAEEGICDFMALAYSRRFTVFQPGWVYNWDGHNEFWEGRNLQNNRIFPASITNQVHVDGQLFGAALYDLALETSFDSAVKSLMRTIPLMVSNMTMPQLARLFLLTDSLYYNGAGSWPLIKAFYPRGLLPGVAVKNVETDQPVRLINSLQFTRGEGDLIIKSKISCTAQLFDISGKRILTIPLIADKEAKVLQSAVKGGTYILHCNGYRFKILKF